MNARAIIDYLRILKKELRKRRSGRKHDLHIYRNRAFSPAAHARHYDGFDAKTLAAILPPNKFTSEYSRITVLLKMRIFHYLLLS